MCSDESSRPHGAEATEPAGLGAWAAGGREIPVEMFVLGARLTGRSTERQSSTSESETNNGRCSFKRG